MMKAVPNMVDTVQHFEPDKAAFTHTQNVGNKLVLTYLDYILTLLEALAMASKLITLFALYSDHRAITTCLQLYNKPEGA